MITINCTTSKEAIIVDRFIRNGIINTRKEELRDINKVIGTKLNLTYHIEENENKEIHEKSG